MLRPVQSVLSRLFERRWLLVILAAIIFGEAILLGQSLLFSLLFFSLVALVALLVPPIGNALGLAPPPRLIETQSNAETVAKEAFQTIVDSLPDPAILLTRDDSLVYFNSEAQDLLRDLQAGLHISSVIRNPKFLDAVSRAHDSVRPISVYYTGRVPIGRRISAVIARIAPKSSDTNAPRLIAIFKDLTHLERINQMRADFITNASHELRTPLASMLGFIETLQGPAKDDPQARKRFLGIMAAQAQHMTRLINDLLSLSRVEMIVHLLPDDRVDVNDAISYVVDTLEPLARDADMSLSLSPLAEPIYVRAERDELVQVVQNLIQNALRYGNKQGKIEVNLKRIEADQKQPAVVAISVIDDGPGIAPEHLPRLTERFYRVDTTQSRDKGGTGLGLAIVKHIVTRHRGELEIQSTPGQGSKFTVTLQEWSDSASLLPD